jgi:hypothetical protein
VQLLFLFDTVCFFFFSFAILHHFFGPLVFVRPRHWSHLYVYGMVI